MPAWHDRRRCFCFWSTCSPACSPAMIAAAPEGAMARRGGQTTGTGFAWRSGCSQRSHVAGCGVPDGSALPMKRRGSDINLDLSPGTVIPSAGRMKEKREAASSSFTRNGGLSGGSFPGWARSVWPSCPEGRPGASQKRHGRRRSAWGGSPRGWCAVRGARSRAKSRDLGFGPLQKRLRGPPRE